MPRIFVIAGEPSGDTIGSKLIHALKQQSPKAMIHGIGGDKMEQEGLKSLFPMSELSLMGFLEIVPHIPKLLKRIRQTVEEIIAWQPDVVVTIDSPGFNFKVAAKLKERGCAIPLVHYVAPTVWAYKPERAFKVARLFEHQLLILPFEAPYFEEAGIPTTYVGHPIVEEMPKEISGNFRKEHHIDVNSPLLCMTAGSRHTELKRLLPVYSQVLEKLLKRFPDLHVVMPTIPTLKKELEKWAGALALPVTIITETQEKYAAYSASNAGIAKSGTNTLEMSMAGLPIIIAYKIHPFSYWWIKRLVKVRFANLLNLVMDKKIIPECIQENCSADILVEKATALLLDKETAALQKKQVQEALEKLGMQQKESPSEKAAHVVLGYTH